MYVRFMQLLRMGSVFHTGSVQLIPDEMFDLNQTRLIKSYQNYVQS